jgi:hypothetical protein
MNKDTANIIYWIIGAFVTCFAMYITESGWPFLIMLIYLIISCDDGEKEENKGDNNNSTTTTSGT